MERVQTILRLSPELMARVKRVAKRENRSVNSFLEHTIEKAVGLDLPRPTQEELDNDPKYAYLYEKYIKA